MTPLISYPALRVCLAMQRSRATIHYLCYAARGRNVLVAEGLSGKRAIERFSDKTLRELKRHNLIDVTELEVQVGDYEYRHLHDSKSGYVITLTPNGKAL
jgi:hypothetical protein